MRSLGGIFLALICFLLFSSPVLSADDVDLLRSALLNLDLKLKQTKVIRGESIPFEVKLSNTGDSPKELSEIAPSNENLHFMIRGSDGKELKASFMTPYLKTGGKTVSDEKATFLLNPRETKIISGDLLNLYGDIESGSYKVTAVFRSKGGVLLKSRESEITVYPANPVDVFSLWEYDRVVEGNLKTAWFNKGTNYTLFYTENNPKNPEVYESSYRVWNFDRTRQIKISAVNTFMQKELHLVWVAGDSIYAIKIKDGKADGTPKVYNVPYKGFELLNPPFTDKNGILHVFLGVPTVKGTINVYMMTIAPQAGKSEKIRIATVPGNLKMYSLFVDTDSNLHFATVSGQNIAYFAYDILGKKMSSEPNSFRGIKEGLKDRLIEVQLVQKFNPSKEKNTVYIYYLTKVAGKDSDFIAYLYEAGGKEPKWYPTMNVYYPERLTMIQGVLDTDLRPYYLFNDYNPKGTKILYKQYFSIDLEEVLPPVKEPKAFCTFPKLILSSSLGDQYAVYLRYVKNMRQFVYQKLEDVEGTPK